VKRAAKVTRRPTPAPAPVAPPLVAHAAPAHVIDLHKRTVDGVDPETAPYDARMAYYRAALGVHGFNDAFGSGGLRTGMHPHAREIDDELRERGFNGLPRMNPDLGLTPGEAAKRYAALRDAERTANNDGSSSREGMAARTGPRRRKIDTMMTVSLVKNPTKAQRDAMRKLDGGCIDVLRASKKPLQVAQVVAAMQELLKLPRRRKSVYRKCRRRLLAAGYIKEG
jgi:hypothetical protein